MSVSAITSLLHQQQQIQALPSSRSGFADLASALTGISSNSSSAGGLLSLLSGTSRSGTSASGTSSSTSVPPSAQSILMGELTALGAQLQAGNLSGAQQAYSTFAKELGATGSQGPSQFHGHGSHPRPVYSGDASNLTTANSASASPLGQPTVLA